MNTENLSTLKIHRLTQAQYDRELAAGRIDENALYLTPDEEVDLSGYATEEFVADAIAAAAYTHPSYTAKTGVPTANQAPGFGGTFTVTQPESDSNGHIKSMTSRTITMPSATATTSASGLMSAKDKTQLNNGGIPIVTATSSDYKAFTATVDGVTAYTVGMKITIIPNVYSQYTAVQLNINGLGNKYIKLPVAYDNSSTELPSTVNLLTANKPLTLEYDGSCFRAVNIPVVSTSNLKGTVYIGQGGTGATTAIDARTNLGAQAQHKTPTATLLATDWSNLSQTVNVDGVTINNTIIISPAPESHEAYNEAGVYCSAQANGQLTFTCAELPTSDLIVNVVVLD